MVNLRLLLSRIKGLWRDERGITGLETSIMLIAFVVVASVFAFAVLRMGIFTSTETEKAVTDVFKETTSILALRGSVVAQGEELSVAEYPGGEYVRSVSFEVTRLLGLSTEMAIDLSAEGTIVRYEQSGICIPLQFEDSGPQPGLNWEVDWIDGIGPILDSDERAKITLNLYGLRKKLEEGKEFSFALMPGDARSGDCVPITGDALSVLATGKVDQTGVLDSTLNPRLDIWNDTITISDGTQSGPYVAHLTFLVHNSAPSGTIDLSGEITVLSYFDSYQIHSDLPFHEDIANTQAGLGWGILGDSGPELGPGERAEIQISLFGLETLLGPGEEFTIEIRPQVGSALIVKDKQVPSELKPGVNRLD